MNKMFLKKRITSILATIFSSTLLVPVTALGVYIDNDDSYGYVNASSGYSSYLTSANYYRNDARSQITGSNTTYYGWYFPVSSYPTSSYKINADFYAYLNGASFNDPSAQYTADALNYSIILMHLNQNSAIAGWNYLGYQSMSPRYSSTVKLKGVTVRTDTTSTYYNTAADGICINYTIQYF